MSDPCTASKALSPPPSALEQKTLQHVSYFPLLGSSQAVPSAWALPPPLAVSLERHCLEVGPPPPSCPALSSYLFFSFLKKVFVLFLAVPGLCYCVWAFSDCSSPGGLLSRYGVRASHCGGFSCCRARALGASVVAEHGLNCLEACGIFLDQGLNACPHALAVRFLTTGPSGKSPFTFAL